MDPNSRQLMRQIIGTDYGWVVVQAVLLIFVGIGGPLGSGRRPALVRALAVGLPLGLAGVAIAGRAQRDLAENLSVSPTPRAGGTLVDEGIYGVIRHPMYLSVALILTGYTVIWRSRLAAAGTLATLLFFGLKTRFEERQLRRAYPHYADYAARVRWRFIPWVI